ncbi:MAG: nicotinamide-nucleotide amidohydrolase family protein [Phycisphaerales bacterium JB065]
MNDSSSGVQRTAAILSIGDELTIGQSLDTNSKWLSSRLTDLGIRVIEHVTVPDEPPSLRAAFERLTASADLVIATGGLGPTADDLTRDVLCDCMGDELVRDEHQHARLVEFFGRRGMPLRNGNDRQALRPASAVCLDNDQGTAPGIGASLNDTDIYLLPGPPHENQPMFERFVVPRLRTDRSRVITTRLIRHYGIPESNAATALGDLLDRDRLERGLPLVGITASDGVITTRLRHECNPDDAPRLLDETDRLIGERIGAYRISPEPGESPTDADLIELTVRELKRAGHALLTAESCTGGLIGGTVTGVSGSSSVYHGGFVTYSNEHKTAHLGVSESSLKRHGAVSETVALEMAHGAIERSPRVFGPEGARPRHALAVTGIAGPDGGTPEKPVGTVWIARASEGEDGVQAEARRFVFPGDRETIRRRTVSTALAMLLLHLRQKPLAKLLWQSS